MKAKPEFPNRFRGFNLIDVQNGAAYIDAEEVVAVVDCHNGEDYKSCVVHLKSGAVIRIAGSAYYQLNHLFRKQPNESVDTA